jgi:hypothetical protein
MIWLHMCLVDVEAPSWFRPRPRPRPGSGPGPGLELELELKPGGEAKTEAGIEAEASVEVEGVEEEAAEGPEDNQTQTILSSDKAAATAATGGVGVTGRDG